MFRIIFKIIKRIIVSFFFIYAYNMFSQSLGIIVPINIVTVGIVAILGVPALLALIFINVLVY